MRSVDLSRRVPFQGAETSQASMAHWSSPDGKHLLTPSVARLLASQDWLTAQISHSELPEGRLIAADLT